MGMSAKVTKKTIIREPPHANTMNIICVHKYLRNTLIVFTNKFIRLKHPVSYTYIIADSCNGYRNELTSIGMMYANKLNLFGAPNTCRCIWKRKEADETSEVEKYNRRSSVTRSLINLKDSLNKSDIVTISAAVIAFISWSSLLTELLLPFIGAPLTAAILSWNIVIMV